MREEVCMMHFLGLSEEYLGTDIERVTDKERANEVSRTYRASSR